MSSTTSSSTNVSEEEVSPKVGSSSPPPAVPPLTIFQKCLSNPTKATGEVNPKELNRLVSKYMQDLGRSTLRAQVSAGTPGKGSHPEKNISKDLQKNDTCPSEVEILYQAGVRIGMDTSQEAVRSIFHKQPELAEVIKPMVEIVEKTESQNGNFSSLPEIIIGKLAGYLNFRSLTQCRLVCQSWNEHISGSDTFLQKSVFVMGHNLDLVQLCKMTQVKWKNIKCHLLPCPDFYSTRSYQQKFLVSKLIKGPKTFFTSGIHSLTLDHIEIQKENLLKWLTSCTLLKSMELRACTFKQAKASWANEMLLKIAERLQEIKVLDMNIVNFVDFGKMILMFTKNLNSLEISLSPTAISVAEMTPLRVKTLEEDMAAVLGLTLERNVRSLQSIGITLQKFQTDGILMKIFDKIGRTDLNLRELTFKVVSGNGKEYLLDGSAQKLDVIGTVKELLKSSTTLQKLHIPFLTLDFSDMKNISWEFPKSMRQMGAQICTPMVNNKSKSEIRSKFIVKTMVLYGKLFNDLEWVDFRTCVPWINELEIHSDVDDHQLQMVIQNLPNLNSLKLENVRKLTDFGLTGVKLKVLKKVSDQLALHGAHGLTSANLPHSGQPLSYISKLRTFICRGSMCITDNAISNGMPLPELEVLEMTGSNLRLTDKSLQRLAFFSPKLRSVTLQLSKNLNRPERIQDFISRLRFLPPRSAKVTLS